MTFLTLYDDVSKPSSLTGEFISSVNTLRCLIVTECLIKSSNLEYSLCQWNTGLAFLCKIPSLLVMSGRARSEWVTFPYKLVLYSFCYHASLRLRGLRNYHILNTSLITLSGWVIRSSRESRWSMSYSWSLKNPIKIHTLQIRCNDIPSSIYLQTCNCNKYKFLLNNSQVLSNPPIFSP